MLDLFEVAESTEQNNGLGVDLDVTVSPLGDFNADGLFDCADVDALVTEIAGMTPNLVFDLDGDHQVTSSDLDVWLALAGAVAGSPTGGDPFLRGDANLDGAVDGQDFLIWNSHKFSSGNGWCGGDFNADGITDGSDFLIWNTNKFMSADTRQSSRR